MFDAKFVPALFGQLSHDSSRFWLSSFCLFLHCSIALPSTLGSLGLERAFKHLYTRLVMRTEDGAKTLVSSECNNNQSVDPLKPLDEFTSIDAPSASAGVPENPKPLEKPVENGTAVEEGQEPGARAAGEPAEVALEGAEVATEAAHSSESFGESGESQETVEASEGVLAWAPEEDHEHKRVKVCSFLRYSCTGLFPARVCLHWSALHSVLCTHVL